MPEPTRAAWPRWIWLALALSLVGCHHTRPEEMSAEAHRAEAAKHEAEAEKEEAEAGNHPTVDLPRAGKEGPLGSYTVESERHRQNAENARAHAAEHRRAAEQLEGQEVEACRDVPLAARSSCPLLAPAVRSVKETERGAVLYLAPGVPVESILGPLRCHLAYEWRVGFSDHQCPLDIRGLSVTRGEEPASIALNTSNAEAARSLHAALRELLGP